MDKMHRSLACVILALLPMAAACGGGGSSDGGVLNEDSSSLTAGFVPEALNPSPETTSMISGSSNGDLVTVKIEVTDTEGVYAAAFDVTYDPDMATYVGFTPGSLLEQGGHSPTYQLDASQPGRVVVGASRNGNVPTVNAAGARNLINLTFQVKQAGSAPLTYGSPQLYDGQAPPQPLPGIHWFAGAITAN